MIKKSLSTKIFLIILCILIIPITVNSIGMSGNKIGTITYEPGKAISVNYDIENYNGGVTYSKSGPLSKYLSYEELSDQGDIRKVRVKLDLPDSLDREPGTYHTTFEAKEKSVGSGKVGAKTAVARRFVVELFSQEKNIEAKLNAPNSNVNTLSRFKVKVRSQTYSDINNVNADINLYNQSGGLVKTLETGEKSLPSDQSITLESVFDNTGFDPGNYEAEAVINYDGKEEKVSKEFVIGDLTVDIKDTTQSLSVNELSKFEILVESKWGNDLENVYGELIVDGQVKLKTSPSSLPAWKERTLKGFWEPELSTGSYDGVVKVYAEDKTFTEEISFDIREDSTGTNETRTPKQTGSSNYTNIVIIISGLIAVLLVAYYGYKKKEEEEENKRRGEGL